MNSRLQTQSERFDERKSEQNTEPAALENEIECPRCHDDMTLCSEFDSLYYFCNECDFCLYTLKKN